MERLGKTVAFIPVRGGSKSIPLKNIKLIHGRPLVYWVLDAAIDCPAVDCVVVSTDSDDIRQAVQRYGSDKIILVDRSVEVSTDTASTESVMLEFAQQYEFDNFLLIQATSPLLRHEHLTEGLTKFNQPDVDSVLSVVRQKRFIWQAINDQVKPNNYDPLHRPRRQDYDGFLVENGAFYITTKELFLATGCRISGTIAAVEMPEETYFEIDEPSDWMIVEKFLEKHQPKANPLESKIKGLKCLLTDCDGVLTDGGMYYSEQGDEQKKFNTRDGMGFQLLRERGFILGIITGENSQLVQRRAEKLKLDICAKGVKDKSHVLDQICTQYHLQPSEVAFIGDDLNDVGILQRVGLACTVPGAAQEVTRICDYITSVPGGSGAVRDVVDLILSVKREEEA
ncbi:MAG: HAD-IIIA family hydrolase [Eubacteriales bacterium]|nr:HAD-IIIA family hydrolase [Eubacteriales bacterium]